MLKHLFVVTSLTCCPLLIGCKQSQDPASKAKTEMHQSQEEKIKATIKAALAESQHDTSTDSSRVRSVCTHCGAWKESDPGQIVLSLTDGAQPGSPEEKQVLEAKKSEAPFFVRHLAHCD